MQTYNVEWSILFFYKYLSKFIGLWSLVNIINTCNLTSNRYHTGRGEQSCAHSTLETVGSNGRIRAIGFRSLKSSNITAEYRVFLEGSFAAQDAIIHIRESNVELIFQGHNAGYGAQIICDSQSPIQHILYFYK